MKTSTPDPQIRQRIQIKALVVHALCGDGKIRKVRLRPGHAAKLNTWLRNASGGQVTLYDVPVAIIAAEPKKRWWTSLRESLGLKLDAWRRPANRAPQSPIAQLPAPPAR